MPALDSTDCSKLWRLRGEVCNRGASPAAAPIFATFYEGHPERGGRVLCTGQTTVPTAPGACQPITCDLLNPPTRSIDLYLRVGDDGKGSRLSSQCKDKNDLAHQPAATCRSIPGLIVARRGFAWAEARLYRLREAKARHVSTPAIASGHRRSFGMGTSL